MYIVHTEALNNWIFILELSCNFFIHIHISLVYRKRMYIHLLYYQHVYRVHTVLIATEYNLTKNCF